jgi:hypothetical protein
MSPSEPSSRSGRLMRWLPWLVGVALLVSMLIWLLPGLERSPAVDGIERETASMLQALGYAEWTDGKEVDVATSGVVRFDEERTAPGHNFFTSRSRSPAVLMGLDGTVVHQWNQPAWERGKWQHVELQPDGSVFLILKHEALVKFSWDSEVLWEAPMNSHHDLDVGPDGRVYVLSQEVRRFPYAGESIPVNDNQIVVLSPEGEVLKEISLYPLLDGFVQPGRFEQIATSRTNHANEGEAYRNGIDALHTNSVEVLREDLGSIAPAGSLLLSVRNLNLVVIINAEGTEVLWSWGSEDILRQHHATALSNGNILLFDNRDGEEWSRVVEVNPATKQVVWEYRGTEEEPFYSYSRGSSQKLENGNVLIAESNSGRAIEVTPPGEIVWEYLNPEISLTKMKRGTFYRMTRIPPGFLEPELEERLGSHP